MAYGFFIQFCILVLFHLCLHNMYAINSSAFFGGSLFLLKDSMLYTLLCSFKSIISLFCLFWIKICMHDNYVFVMVASAQTSGTTVTFVIIEGWTITVASVGDSRCILEPAEGGIYYLSADHRLDCNEEE